MPTEDLEAVCQRMADDYQTSDAHHPQHVLVGRADFETMVAALTPREEAPAEGAGELADRVIALGYTNTAEYALATAYNNLRARTSEPEAGEAWKDQRLSRIERVKMHRVAFGSDLKTAINAVDEHAAVSSILAKIPAPATADKLRVAVEAVLNADAEARERLKAIGCPLNATPEMDALRQALAALS